MKSVDVCICTFRRASIVEAIESVARQDIRADIEVRVIVADNDTSPSAEAAVTDAAALFGIAVRYVHAPERNISIARNACLDAATAAWVAFIDDDEVAAPNWLRRLIVGYEDSDIIFGVSKALIRTASAPKWLATGEFHSNQLDRPDALHNGYTCNVLLRLEFVKRSQLRFLQALGQTGGEDSAFFDDARRAGARFKYNPDAIVYEDIPDHRANLSWLLRRRFRSGQTHYVIMRRRGELSKSVYASAFAKIVYCTVAGLMSLTFSRARAVRALLRGALHLGVLSSALGRATHMEYS